MPLKVFLQNVYHIVQLEALLFNWLLYLVCTESEAECVCVGGEDIDASVCDGVVDVCVCVFVWFPWHGLVYRLFGCCGVIKLTQE